MWIFSTYSSKLNFYIVDYLNWFTENKNEHTEIIKLSGPTIPTHMVPDFKNLHLCQDIAMERVILYNARELYKYKQGDMSELGDNMKGYDGRLTCYHRVRYWFTSPTARFVDPISMHLFQVEGSIIVTDSWLSGLEKCNFDLGTYSHNPLKEWLQAHKKEDFPGFKIYSNSVSVDWGLAEQFKFNSTPAKIKSIQ